MADDQISGRASKMRDHLALVGLVANLWATFETLIDRYVLSLGQIPVGPGWCLTSQVIGSARKLDAYIALAKLRYTSDALVKELNILAKNAAALAEQRNRIIHDTWVFDENKPAARIQITARRILVAAEISVSEEDIMKIADKITFLRTQFISLHKRIMASLST